MLGLPIMSRQAGFTPSIAMFLLGWLFMTTTALCLLEVNLSFDDEVSLISMAERTLGLAGKVISWISFVFLFYALGVAYIAGTGELIAGFIHNGFGIAIPHWAGGLTVCILFAGLVYLGTHSVVVFNKVLMAGLLVSYLSLVALGLPHIHLSYLQFKDWSIAYVVLPLTIISFGFHNMIPTITQYLKRDAKKLRFSIFLGSLLPLFIYLLWETVILGLVPAGQIGQNDMATELLKNVAGELWATDAAQYFALFAILTSFLGNSLSFVDFLADGLRIKKTPAGKGYLCALVIIPAFIPAVFYPHIFLSALNYAGTYGAVILFGILPALMAWSGRYWQHSPHRQLVPGGKITLVSIILFAMGIISLQFF